MKFDTSKLDNVKILDRICAVYGFHQKIQLANHFDIAASSLSNRYSRGNVSFDFAALCSIETGTDLNWILTGDGKPNAQATVGKLDNCEVIELDKFTISESNLTQIGTFGIDVSLLSKPDGKLFCVMVESAAFIIEESSVVSDGEKLIDVDGVISIREIAVLPGKRLHVTGGKIPFECSFEDIRVLGRVVGIYREVK
ncbi:phage repressor protein CI [Pantoea rwandensis]|uniref:Repressor n=1 Tax=Pantoea rwandensis TaxID=1076550 RepID=A0ABM5RFX3_9GAMM|nr:phage repressor protein CI [Pantoea rwandensis]AIR84867.1 repressor [Pantoea rwandensis]